jgi:XTP/dITP diphosphohydrolase
VSTPLLFGTRSAGKQREIRDILRGFSLTLVFPDDIGLGQLPEEEMLEDRETFEGNALRKAEYFSRRSRLPTVAEDSGLEVFSLGGLPGVRSRRFAPPSADQDAANNAELLRRLAGAPASRRRARYRAVAVYLANPDAVPRTFEGECNGAILEVPRGAGGFGYDPLFLSDELEQTFAEAEPAAKHKVSHRGRALQDFRVWFEGDTRNY